MVRETSTLTPHQPHGPVASAVKWAFKSYIRAQRALGDVVVQARAEAHAGTAETPSASPPVTAESVAHDEMIVRWISSDATEQRTVEELGSLLDRAEGFVWVDIPTVNDAAERVLTDVFRFHPLAVRDCREPGHVPKVHAYADHLFMMLQVPERGPNGQIQHRELNQFIGSPYLVTVHKRLGASPPEVEHLETSAVVGRLEAGRVHPRTPAELSYAITTRLSARMEALVSELARSVASLNQSLREGRLRVSETVIDEMFELRDALLAVETIATQNHAICARMATLTTRVASPGPHPLLNDILDQFELIRDLCRAKRELLQGVLDFTRTRATTRMDRVMSRIALLGAVALPVAVISDLYGMNVLVFQPMHLNVLAMILGAVVILTLGMFRLRPT
jgi:Mg2+ and Co2+ transporter CorA